MDKEIEMTRKNETSKATAENLVNNSCRKNLQTFYAKEKTAFTAGLRDEKNFFQE